jgi:hypothetical protein
MAEPTYLLMTEDTALTESRVLTANPNTSNIQLIDGGPTSDLTIDTVLNLGSLAAISTPGLTTYIGGNEFASRGITSSGSINVTDGVGTTGNIILDVADNTSTQKVNVEVNNVSAGPSQSTLNFIAGTGVSIASSVNGSQYEVSISSTGGGGGGSGTVTSVDAQCNFEGITFSGVPITTAGTIDLNLPTTDTALNKVLGITNISPLTVGWIPGGGGGGGVTSVAVTVHATPGNFVYTPTVGMKFVCVEIAGGGGSGQSPAPGGPSFFPSGTGGGGGGYCKRFFSAAEIGASQNFTVGAGGASVTNANGIAGEASSFGSFMTANGGGRGSFLDGQGGTATGGDVNIFGSPGSYSFVVSTDGLVVVSWIPAGGNSFLCTGNATNYVDRNNSVGGKPGVFYGGGGGSSYAGNGWPAQPSGAGANGVVIITEYL